MRKSGFTKVSLLIVFILSLVTFNIYTVKGEGEKVIYLTFDDGPSPNNTLKVLEILKEEKVPATFFVIGENAEKYPKIVKELDKNGMAIGAHSYTHRTSYIYKSKGNYSKDLQKCIESINTIIGKNYIDIIRMPCGSSNNNCNKGNKTQIKDFVKNKNLSYIDWNVSGEDAIGKNVPKNRIKNNILKSTKGKECIVLLLHDGYYNTTSMQVLKEVIKYYKDQGYTFKSLKNLPKEERTRLEKLKILNK